MGSLRRRRVWLAVLLAVVVSGLGHAYLRRWGRAFGWYLLITATLVFIVPDAALNQFVGGERPPLVDILPALLVAVASVIDAYVLAVRNNREYDRAQRERADAAVSGDIDAFAGGDHMAGTDRFESDGSRDGAAGQDAGVERDAAVGDRNDADDGPPTRSCPNCGRETDAEIDFCHWCTDPLPGSDG